MTRSPLRVLQQAAPRPLVVWWWDRDRDIDVPRQHAISWTEIDGLRSGLIRVPRRRCQPDDPDDPIVAMEVQLQTSCHFAGPIEVDHASRHTAELDPMTRLRAGGHKIIHRRFDGRYESQYRGGVVAERDNDGEVEFAVIIADHLSAVDERSIADWSWTMIKTFQIEGPGRWTPMGKDRWQLPARSARPSAIEYG